MIKMQEQAERFGAEIVLDDVVSLDLAGDVKTVTLGNGDVHEAPDGDLRDRFRLSQARHRG